jgi:DNA-directed RNA polymerase subunit RPC12/RpoP
MALCTSCGNQVEESASFCTTCGHRMPAGVEPSAAVTVTRPACSSCGAQVDPDSAFCTECGQKMATEPVPVPVVDTVSVPAALSALSAQTPVTSTLVQPVVTVPLPVESTPAEEPAPPAVEPAPQLAAPVYVTPREYPPAQPAGGGALRAIVPVLLLLIVIGGFGAWYFMGVETVIVSSPPDVTVYLDDKELTPASYGRYVVPHLSRSAHLLRVQRAGFADTIERLDFPLSSLHEWVNIKLVPRRQMPSSPPR